MHQLGCSFAGPSIPVVMYSGCACLRSARSAIESPHIGCLWGLRTALLTSNSSLHDMQCIEGCDAKSRLADTYTVFRSGLVLLPWSYAYYAGTGPFRPYGMAQ